MIPSVSFALARYGRRMQRQEAEVIRVDAAGFHLMRRQKMLESFAWKEIVKLTFIASQSVAPRMFQMLGGSLFQQREARWVLETEAGSREFWLEMDTQFRRQERLELFQALYEAGLPLEERSALGGKLYLGKLSRED